MGGLLSVGCGMVVACLGWTIFGLPWTVWLLVALLVAIGVRTVVGPSRRRWARRALVLSGALVLVVSGAVLASALTPSVADAGQRVGAQAARYARPDPILDPPPRVADALIATEDSRFYVNGGMDLLGVGRAALGLVRGGDPGGATLEQQLAKLVYSDGQDTLAARWEDMVLAVKLAHAWSKQSILEMYLTAAYFGHGFFGLHAASVGYFHRPPDRLSWPQAALLAGLVQAPTADDPLQHPATAAERRAHVLERLVATGFITPAQEHRFLSSSLVGP